MSFPRFLCALAGLALLVLSVPGADKGAGQAVLDQAITAQGGQAALENTRVRVRRSSGTTLLAGQKVNLAEELTMDLPDRFRLVLDFSDQGIRRHIILAVDGERGWRSIDGKVVDLSKDDVAEFRDEVFVAWMGMLVPLKKGNFELRSLADVSLDGRPAAVLRVAAKGHADSQLSFDRRSGLLVRVERRARLAGVEVNRAYSYGEYRDFGGARMPAHEVQFINGRQQTELSVHSYRFPGHADDALFRKP